MPLSHVENGNSNCQKNYATYHEKTIFFILASLFIFLSFCFGALEKEKYLTCNKNGILNIECQGQNIYIHTQEPTFTFKELCR